MPLTFFNLFSKPTLASIAEKLSEAEPTLSLHSSGYLFEGRQVSKCSITDYVIAIIYRPYLISKTSCNLRAIATTS